MRDRATKVCGREVAQAAFRLARPPRLPVTLIAGGAWMTHAAGRTFAELKQNPKTAANVVIRAFEQVGYDMIWVGSGYANYPIHLLGCPIQDDSSEPTALLGTVVSSLNEVESLDIGTVTTSSIMQAIIRSQHMVADSIGKRVLLLSVQWGPLTCAARILGVEAAMRAMIEEPEAFLELLRFSTELIWAVSKPALAHADILGMAIADPLASGDLISPQTFSVFAGPFLAELVRRLRTKGKYSMIHICGDTSRILKSVLQIRPDCFSLDQKVDLLQAKEILCGKVCVAGNLSPTGAILNGKPDDVLAEARDCLRSWGQGPGFILTLGCDYPSAVPIRNVEALMSMKAE